MPTLRIIYQNQADLSTTTITSSTNQSASTTVSNLKLDTKSQVWRTSPTTISSTQVKGDLIVDLGSLKTVGGVVLAFTNLNSSSATIRVRGYTSPPAHSSSSGSDSINFPIVNGTSVVDTGNIVCCPWNTMDISDWGTNPVGSSNYSYGGGTYARVWLNTAQAATLVRYLSIEVTDYYTTSSTGRYIEVSKLIIGKYWSPKYNAGYGVSAGIKDMSEHTRTQSGDLLTTRGPMYQCVNFNLEWLSDSDRQEMAKILTINGMSRPLLISLFPDGTTTEEYERERAHQIYGKLSQLSQITYNNPFMYSIPLELEEV
jgi:hypothetical protein